MAKATTKSIPLDLCITCSSKHNRVRPSLCQCKHCSNSFCFDCIKAHNDELQENIALMFNHHNELKSLIQSQRKFIKDETLKSKKQFSEWFGKYIDNLIAEEIRIDKDIDNTEKEGQDVMDNIEAKLQAFSVEIEGFAKVNTFYATRMDELLDQINELTQRASSLIVTREYDLPSTMPKYKFKFEETHPPTMKIDTNVWRTTKLKKEETPKADTFILQSHVTYGIQDDASISDEESVSDVQMHEPTTYVVHCMASDGINVMYSVIENTQHDFIAYCYLDVNDINYRQADPSRAWFLPRIVDMIWWKSVKKFICGTANGICTVEYRNHHFKILTVIHDRWTNIRIAANTNSLWVHEDGSIKARCMVRTDGADRFFIAAGKYEFYSMTSRGAKRTISLQNQADCLAVLNNHRIVFTKSRAELELAEW